ncbi:MAG: kinesin-like protein Klp5 [Piccolia ochrophora]|nr:MAG: kinesin-like protein Klp5 [Piccolia ochrophora]
MANADGASSISVTVRVRPFTIREAAQLTKLDDGPFFLGDGSLAAVPTPKLIQKGIRPVVKVVDEKCLVFDPPEDNPVQRFSKSVVPNSGKRVKDQTFGFDRVFDENTTQGDVYEATTRNLLESVLDGYNATVFAYGATGCGKTHTITGTAQQPGIIFLTMQELFERIGDRSGEKESEISLSYLEIYNETIRDLLVPGGSKAGLMLREDANQTVSVPGLSSHRPQNVEEVMDMIMRGNEYRTMSPTEANATSSRSHAVLQINISQRDRNADVNEPHTMATLSIIDLAGSERASATKNRGERLLEGANINKSLLALGSCINALCDPRKKNHVPYRNSKLTRLLKFSLGGNCKTVMIVCVSPSSQHFDETQNTLRYANRAKNIQTKVTRNVYNVNRHVKDFLKKIDEQMTLINELKQQQKDYEATSFVKFKRQSDKKEAMMKEGMARIRNAFDHSAAERMEKLGNMKKLRQIERRISVISSWVAAFDGICESREDDEMPKNLTAMRKTAQGILAELEGSRQHYHQRLAKCNWERAVDTALQTGIRQVSDVDGGDAKEVANLTREAELLKSNGERDGLKSLVDQERASDATVVQALLSAHFQTVASIDQIMSMDEDGAIETAKNILLKILTSCSEATAQVIKPDGGLPSNEYFPPTRMGTPKKRKPAHLLGPSPMKPAAIQRIVGSPQVGLSPIKGSPRRWRVGMAKKGVSFTPKKKSPGKRAVRWRDDTENGTLAEFEKTPQKVESTPEVSSAEPEETVPAHPALPTYLTNSSSPKSDDSSPLLTSPQLSMDIRPKSSRFQAGFLSKKIEGSSPQPASIRLPSSDSEVSPLRDLEPSKASNRSSLHQVEMSSNDSGSNSGSDGDFGAWKADRTDAMKIKSAIKRMSSVNGSAGNGHGPGRNQRRRSPGSTRSSSPPHDNSLFTAGQARRMVKSDKENSMQGSVLSPRTAPVVKPNRRTTIGEGRAGSGLAGRDAVRLSAAAVQGYRSRESVGVGMLGKNVWR